MPARLDPPAEQRRRSRAIQQIDHDWTLEQVAIGVDGPVPPGRPEISDYNLHVPQVEAGGAALDDFFARVRLALGLPRLP